MLLSILRFGHLVLGFPHCPSVHAAVVELPTRRVCAKLTAVFSQKTQGETETFHMFGAHAVLSDSKPFSNRRADCDGVTSACPTLVKPSKMSGVRRGAHRDEDGRNESGRCSSRR